MLVLKLDFNTGQDGTTTLASNAGLTLMVMDCFFDVNSEILLLIKLPKPIIMH